MDPIQYILKDYIGHSKVHMDSCEHTSLQNSITYLWACMYIIYTCTYHSYHFTSPQRLQTLSNNMTLYCALVQVCLMSYKSGSSQRRKEHKKTVYAECEGLFIN